MSPGGSTTQILRFVHRSDPEVHAQIPRFVHKGSCTDPEVHMQILSPRFTRRQIPRIPRFVHRSRGSCADTEDPEVLARVPMFVR